jgi:glycosyltransferase involved in cell wall biosynthesis
MRVGINEVLLLDRSSGARQREFNLLPTLLRAIRESGDEATIYVSAELADSHVQTLIGSDAGARVIRTPVPALPTPARIARGAAYFRRRTREDSLDVFHTNYFPPPPIRVPTVLSVNDLRFLHFPETYTAARLAFLRTIVPYSLRRAERIAAISSDTKNDIVSYFGVPEHKVDVVPVPANESFHRVEAPELLREVRAKLSLPQSYILFVGHLEPRKNLRRLVTAYKILHRQIPDVPPLVILGKESFGFAPILEDARRSGLSHKIHFTGFVSEEDLAAAYTMASMLAFPSLHEGFGVPVLEAMACGVPVLTSNTSALPEVAGEAAMLVDPLDVDSIAQGMATLLREQALCATLVERGMRRVQEYSAERSARLMLDTYERALYTSRARSAA